MRKVLNLVFVGSLPFFFLFSFFEFSNLIFFIYFAKNLGHGSGYTRRVGCIASRNYRLEAVNVAPGVATRGAWIGGPDLVMTHVGA